MKTIKLTMLIITLVIGLFLTHNLYAGVPLNNIEGVGGIAFNPLAYPAGQNKDTDDTTKGIFGLGNTLSKPQFGVWYVNLGQVNVDWTSFSLAETFFDRLELSYGHEIAAVDKGPNIAKDNFGAKVLLIKENQFDTNYVPAISAGLIYKSTDNVSAPYSNSGVDLYLVGTKLITQLPKPVLVSAGILGTRGLVTGVLGYDHSYRPVGFGNIDVIPLPKLAVGLEFKQGARFDDFKNANYFDAHVAWFANKNLTLVGAYVNTGDQNNTTTVGLGQGVVLSAQYAF